MRNEKKNAGMALLVVREQRVLQNASLLRYNLFIVLSCKAFLCCCLLAFIICLLCLHVLDCVVTLIDFVFLFVISNALGSSPIFLMALFVMCAVCFVGTAVIIFQKSRDKHTAYTVLVGGEQE